MSNTRASIFAGLDDDLDVSGFAPEAAPDRGPDPETLRAVSEKSHFPSREPKNPRANAAPPAAFPRTPEAAALAAPPKRQPRRHRTGRTAQFNARTTPETVAQFYAIADRQDWLVGETLERALAALQRELGQGG